jgi:aquaporin SIP
VGGALAISELMPAQYKHILGGPSLKVDPHTGAIAEGVLTFVITMAVLWIIVKGPRNPILKTWMLSLSTVSLVLSGAAYTGPSMNPANVSPFSFLSQSVTIFTMSSIGASISVNLFVKIATLDQL